MAIALANANCCFSVVVTSTVKKKCFSEIPVAKSTSASVYGELVLLIRALQSHEKRETALAILSKNRENREDLAPLLWSSFGTISTLLQEIISVYCSLSSTDLTERASRRASDALALFQVQNDHFEEFFSPELDKHGYQALFKRKTNELVLLQMDPLSQ